MSRILRPGWPTSLRDEYPAVHSIPTIDLPRPGFSQFDVNWNSPQAKGLVCWVKFYAAGSYATSRDYIKGRNGSHYTGTVTYKPIASPVGTGLYIGPNAILDEIFTWPNLSELNGISQMSMSCWIYRGADNNSSILAGAQDQGNDYESICIEHYTDEYFYFSITPDNGYAAGRVSWPYAGWWHTVMVFDGTQSGNADKLKGYINGVQQTLDFLSYTIPSTTPTITTPYELSSETEGNAGVDDVRFYTRALSPVEVWQLYAPDTRHDLYRPSVRRLWNFDVPLDTAPIKPVVKGYERPPVGETFTTNWSSPQAKGLGVWFPSAKPSGSVLREQMVGANGTLGSNVGWKFDARVGWGVERLADNNDYVTISPATALPRFGWEYPFTVSAWVMLHSKLQWQCIFGDGTANTDYITLYVQQGDSVNAVPGFYMNIGGSGFARSAGLAAVNYLNLNTPYLLTFTWDPSQSGYYRGKVYINARDASSTSGSPGSTGSGYVSQASPQILNNPVWDEPLDGAVWDLRVYRRTLSPADVLRLYNRNTRFDLYKPVIRIGGIVEVEAEEPTIKDSIAFLIGKIKRRIQHLIVR